MTKRKTSLLAFAAAALVSLLLLPLTTSAQSNGPWWGRNRDGNYGRNRSDYERRVLRDAARRLKDRSRSFQSRLDSALDRSRYDDTRREDNINHTARDFRNAADRFEDRVDDSRDLNRSESEARNLLSIAARLDRQISRVRLDSRAASDWSQIRNDLRTIADIYGLRLRDFDGGYGRGDDDRYRRDRDRRDNGGGWRWPNF